VNRFKRGDRVQLHPATDRWMMGDRFGEVVQVSLRVRSRGKPPPLWKYKILLDRSEEKIWFKEQDLQEVQ